MDTPKKYPRNSVREKPWQVGEGQFSLFFYEMDYYESTGSHAHSHQTSKKSQGPISGSKGGTQAWGVINNFVIQRGAFS